MAASPPCLFSQIKNCRVRVSPTLVFFFVALLSPLSSSAAGISYSDHCNSFLPGSTPTDLLPPATADLLQIPCGYYSGGGRILGGDANSTLSAPRSFSFLPRLVSKTLAPQTLNLAGTLTFRGGGIRIFSAGRSLLLRFHPRNPRTFNRIGRARFDLEGFWSGADGRLCMVGEGSGRSGEGKSLELSAVFKLNYPNVSDISSAVVSGIVESLDDSGSANYFEPIRVIVYDDERNYEFTRVPEAVRYCAVVKAQDESIGFQNGTVCDYVSSGFMQSYRLEYRGNCSQQNCGPFGRSLGFPPRFMSLYRTRCLEDGKVHLSMAFSTRNGYLSRTFEPQKTLVGEGAWDQEKKRLCLVACHVPSFNGSSLQGPGHNCAIGLTLWFPSVLSIRHLSTISGRIWSDRDEKDPAYFDMVSFGNVYNGLFSFRTSRDLKYSYTKTDLVNRSCLKLDASVIGKRYPDGKKVKDMSFTIAVRSAGGNTASGYADLLFVGETLYHSSLYSSNPRAQIPVPSVDVNITQWNVSYHIGYGNVDSYEGTEISAEGIYDVETGMLCMAGCRHVGSSRDCGILINIQLASLNPEEGEYTEGKIWSTREKSDPLFFEPFEITSSRMYRSQAAQSMRWKDIEIAMVMVSLTLSCIFIGFQLYHANHHSDVLPSISITMLVILALGHMIPLVLNSESLFFKNHNGGNALLQSDGWLEMNEVVARVIAMVAFLLQCRLLQVAWSARSADEGEKGMWAAERKSLRLCLPIYTAGGMISLFIHFLGTQHKRQLDSPSHHHFLWEDLMSYAGLILDGFLFPQFLLNIFCNSKDKSLAPAFYVGNTVVRALPHVYNAYRAHQHVPHLQSTYTYAGRNMDIYSSAWDIIIPFGGVPFAVLICLQQRFGGAITLPRGIREPGGYEMVPVVTS